MEHSAIRTESVWSTDAARNATSKPNDTAMAERRLALARRRRGIDVKLDIIAYLCNASPRRRISRGLHGKGPAGARPPDHGPSHRRVARGGNRHWRGGPRGRGERAGAELVPALRQDDLLARSLRAPDVLDAVKRVRASGAPERVTWLERVPVERFFELNAAPMEGPQFEPAMILTLRDLSEARRVERMRVDFVANASHDIADATLLPARICRDAPGARARGQGSEDTVPFDHARTGAKDGAAHVDDLLSLSRIEQNLHLRPRTQVDIVAILRHIADTLAPMATDNDLVLQLDVPAKALVTGDRDALLRLAENLIQNAIKYGASDPRSVNRQVEIALAAETHQCVLIVRDHGPGIAPEHLPRLQNVFTGSMPARAGPRAARG